MFDDDSRSSSDHNAGVPKVPLNDVGHVRGPEPDPWYDTLVRPKNEVPLRYELTVSPTTLEKHLGLQASRRGLCGARSALIANAMYANARSPSTWVFYSRDRNHYALQTRARRYAAPFYTYANMMAAVESLDDAGLIEHRKTAPSSQATHRSRIRASNLLLKRLTGVELAVNLSMREVVVLRDANRLPIDYRDSERICAQRKEILAQNEFLSGVEIRIAHPDARYDENGFLRIGSRWLDPRQKKYRRVFSERWSLGGRWYGPFWQALPGDFRRQLRLDGQSVVELDYRACHLRLLCARAGMELPFDESDYDPYALPGLSRRHVKCALAIMLNASTQTSARRAIATELDISHAEAARLMQALQSHWPLIERYWCSGVGMELQNADAEICAGVQRRMRRAGVPALSIHDSFIVPSRDRSALADVMAGEMERACAKLASTR